MKAARMFVLCAVLLGTSGVLAFGQQQGGWNQNQQDGDHGRDDRASNRDRDHDGDRDKDRDRDDRWKRDRDRDGDHDRDDRWNRGRGQGGWINTARQNGYQDGLNDGRNDRWNNKGFRPAKDGNYKHADRGYQSAFGNKDQYKDTYRESYSQGYQQGFYQDGGRR